MSPLGTCVASIVVSCTDVCYNSIIFIYIERCEERDTAYPGNNIKVIMNVPSWNMCSKYCSELYGCVLWAWAQPTYHFKPFRNGCWLKSQKVGKETRLGTVTGGKGCSSGMYRHHIRHILSLGN